MQYAIVKTSEKTGETFNDNGSSDARVQTHMRVMSEFEAEDYVAEVESDGGERRHAEIVMRLDTDELIDILRAGREVLEGEVADHEPDDTPMLQEEDWRDEVYGGED